MLEELDPVTDPQRFKVVSDVFCFANTILCEFDHWIDATFVQAIESCDRYYEGTRRTSSIYTGCDLSRVSKCCDNTTLGHFRSVPTD